MIPDYIAFTILEKVKTHREKPPTAKLIYLEIPEFKLAEITYRYFLESLVNRGLIKLMGENKDDWGDIYIMPKGEQFVNDYVAIPMYHRNEDLGQYLNSLMIKDTGDLIRAKKSAQIQLDNQKRIYEMQKTLAERGKRNILDFQIREVNIAELTIKRIEDELELRSTLNMETHDRIGGDHNHTIPDKTQTPEDEWKKEAIKKGLRNGTADYHNFIQTKKLEQKSIDDEALRKKDFEYYVGKNNIYCPNMEDFRQQIAIKKLNPDKYKYLEWLWDEKVRYINAKHYYDTWGERGTGINRTELYEKIIQFIHWEIEDRTIQKTSGPKVGTETPSETEKFTLGDYALMQVYLSKSNEGESVTNKNKDTIANKYGFKGQKFYQEFNKYLKPLERTGTSVEKKDNAKLKRFERVMILLKPYPIALKRANDERKTFLIAYNKLY